MKNQQNLEFIMKSACNNFYGMGANYFDRLVKNDKIKNVEVDTVYATDTDCYETGIQDRRYYSSWMIVEEYDTKEEALKGHNKWVKKLTTGKPPKELPNVQGEDSFYLK